VEFRGQVAARLRSLRGWLGWTQGELAVKAGVTRNFVSAVECGGIGLDAWRLRLVAHALGTTLDRLLSDSHLNRDLHSDLHSDLPGDLDRDLADGLDSYVERGAGRPEQEAEPFDR
jgi:transcriptional regulator with XRE-family HTH domain